MSVSTLTSIAAVRDRGTPTKGDVGKHNAKTQDQGTVASMSNLLVSAVPTELVAPYTAVTAVIVGSVAKATKAAPNPDHYETWRWLMLAILLLATAGSVWVGARRKGSTRRLPLLEMTAAVTAATGWALALPNSPLALHLDKGERTFVPAVTAFAAVALTGVLASGMQAQAKSRPRRRRRGRTPAPETP